MSGGKKVTEVYKQRKKGVVAAEAPSPSTKRKKLSLAEALELLEKPAHKGSEGQSTSKKDTKEAEVGEKPAKKKAKTSKRAIEEKCDQLKWEIYVLEGKRGKLSERELELEEQLRQVRHEVEEVEHTLLTKKRSLEKTEDNQRLLDKLPRELWDKILDELEENDLFPLALSCRYFRQKQKELVAWTRQQGPESGKPRLALKTNLKQKRKECQPASAEYLRFCSKEEGSSEKGGVKWARLCYVIRLAAYHGHLSLLQELNPRYGFYPDITKYADESSFPPSFFRLQYFDFFLSFSSQWKDANWRPCSGRKPGRASSWT